MGGLWQGIRRYRGRLIVAAVIVAIPVLALAWWLGSPLFINRTVDEPFPYSVNAVVPEGMTQGQVEQTMATMAMMDTETVAEALPSLAPDEMMAVAMDSMTPETMAAVIANMTPEMRSDVAEAVADAAPGMTPEMVAGMMESMTPETIAGMMESIAPEMTAVLAESMTPEMMVQMAATMPEMMASMSPAVVKRGAFRDADSFHQGEGSATVYQLPDGSYVLRFEDFRVTNGPDLRVLLASHPDPQGRNEVQGPGYVELGKLKGNIGNQNYPFPEGVSPDDYGSVVIYCKPFHVVFSVAPLSEG
ncbi:MAG: DM13 domain-containing protein [Chloroflexota bacterium]|nr:DM13 domain-containing protein [Chloroflexota bacterium]MDE2885028.1 DM13 domain-containing protein [Chloroflexota bacterium]